MEVGKPRGLHPGHTSSIRRIEAAMLSYNADMTAEDNPFELGMGHFVSLDNDVEFIGKEALMHIKKTGVTKHFIGMEIDGDPLVGSNDTRWPLLSTGESIGYVTSAIYSPRLDKNIALAMVDFDRAKVGSQCKVEFAEQTRNCVVVPKPFFDPKKSIAISA